MRRLFATLICSMVMVGVLSGCSTTNSNSAPLITFQNRTKEDVITPDQKLDPSPVKGETYSDIPVLNAAGETVHLDVAQTPILFVAYWCPHCQRTLVLLQKEQQSLKRVPVLVALGYEKGTSLQSAVRVEQEEEKSLGLHGFKVYYALSAKASDTYAPQGYPTLAYQTSSGDVMTLYGEHTWSVWKKVFN